MNGLILIVLMAAIAWLLLIRPQRRRQMAQNAMLRSIELGDEIVTAGGLYGYVRELRDDELVVEIAPGTNVRIARRAVGAVLEPDEEADEEADEGDEELEEAEEEEPVEAEEGPAAAEKPR